MSIITFDTEQFEKDYSRMMKSLGSTGVGCIGVSCCKCLLGKYCGHSKYAHNVIELVLDWVKNNPEVLPEVDWDKVPPDTEVLVWGNSEDKKRIRHFASFLPAVNQRFHCFNDGFKKVSASTIVSWKFCELLNPEDIEKYKKK